MFARAKLASRGFVVAIMLIATVRADAAAVFYEDFSDNDAGWVLGSEWQIGAASASSGHTSGNPDPSQDFTPTSDNGVAGAMLGGNVTTDIHFYRYLESPAIDTTSLTTAVLQYARWLNSDYTPYMNNTVEVYDGTAWNIVWQSGATPAVTDSAWTPQSFDITPFSNAALRVRFGFNVDSADALVVSGWNVDDVQIVPEPASVGLVALLAGLAAQRRQSR